MEIKWLSDSDLCVLFLHISELLGITKVPEQSQIKILSDFVRKYFSKTEAGKIPIAFEFYIGGKLPIEYKNAYRLHSGLFSSVVNSYLNAYDRQDQASDYQREQFDRHEWFDYLKNEITNYYETGDYKLRDYGNPFWHFLTEKGLINFTQERREQIKKYVEEGRFKEPEAYHSALKGSEQSKIKRCEVFMFLMESKKSGRDILNELTKT